jgi:hypothetical protein
MSLGLSLSATATRRASGRREGGPPNARRLLLRGVGKTGSASGDWRGGPRRPSCRRGIGTGPQGLPSDPSYVSGLEREWLEKSDAGFTGPAASLFAYPDHSTGHRLHTALVWNDVDELSRQKTSARPDPNAELGEVNPECTVGNLASVGVNQQGDRLRQSGPLGSTTIGRRNVRSRQGSSRNDSTFLFRFHSEPPTGDLSHRCVPLIR